MVRKKQERLKPTEQVLDRQEKPVGFASGTDFVYQPYSSMRVKDIYQLMRQMVWVEAAINVIADEVIKYPLFTTTKDAEIDAFLDYPSEKEPLFLIRKKYIKDMLRWGNGVCLIGYKSGKPYELMVTPGYTLRVTNANPPTYKLTSGTGSSFKQVNNKDIVLQNKEVMHFQIDADSDSTLAKSPIEKIYNDVDLDVKALYKLNQFISRGFYKPSFVSFGKGQSINKKSMEAFMEYLNAMVDEGARFFGVNKEANVTTLPHLEIKELLELDNHIGMKVATAFKVPPFMLNLVADTGSLNAREQKARFTENVICPILKLETYIYTLQLVRKGFKNTKTAITSIELATRLNLDRAKIANLLTSGDRPIMTVNEVRETLFNLPPLTNDIDNTQ